MTTAERGRVGRASSALGPHGVLVEAPEVLVMGDIVALRGQALRDAYRLMLRGVQVAEVRDGIAPSRGLSSLIDVMRRVVDTSAVPVTEFRPDADSRESEVSTRIGTGEAKDILNVSDRWVRHLASELDGRKISGRWTYDKSLVLAAATRLKKEN